MGRGRFQQQHDDDSSDDRPKTTGRRRGRKWFLILPIAILAILWFAPAIVVTTGVCNWMIAAAVPEFPGTIVIGNGSVGWLSPIRLRDVAIWDAEGNPVARIPLVTSDKQLFQLVTETQRLGTFRLHKPEFQVVLTEDSTNVEELLIPFERSVQDSSTAQNGELSASVGVEVIDGSILIRDLITDQQCVVENLHLELSLPDSAPAPLRIHVTADAQQAAERGRLSANFEWQMPRRISERDWGDGQLQLKAEGFPLIALQPLLRRTKTDLRVTGQLVADVDVRWHRNDRGPEVTVAGSVSIHEPRIAMPSMLGTDEVHLQKMAAIADLTVQDDVIQVNTVQFHSDLAELEVSGTAELRELRYNENLLGTLLNWQSSHHYTVDGQVNIAKLASQLPDTLRLKTGMQITQGQVRLNIDSRIEMGYRILKGTLQTDRIEAVGNGRRLTWDQPLHVAVNGVSFVDGVQIRQLTCQSDFLQIDAQGTLDEGSITAEGDLREMASQLGRFCELGDLQLAGKLKAQGGWKQTSRGDCVGELTVNVRKFAIASSTIAPFDEDELEIKTNAQGTVRATGIERLDRLRLQVTSGEDRLIAQLDSPIDEPGRETTWPLTCHVTGYTESWLARLQPWVDTGTWDLHAGLDANMSGTLHRSRMVVNPCQVQLTNVNARGDGWLIREPRLQLRGEFQWNAAGDLLIVPDMTISSSAISARGNNISVVLDRANLAASGSISYRADLNRIGGWQYSPQPPTLRLLGELEGQAQISTEQGVISFDGDANINNFAFQRRSPSAIPVAETRWSNVWTEPTLRVTARGAYRPSDDELDLNRVEGSGTGLSIVGSGKLAKIGSQPEADIQGMVDYDLAILAKKLRDVFGPNVHFAGRRQSSFAIRGPLVAESVSVSGAPSASGPYSTASVPVATISPNLAAEASLGWDSLSAYGITLAPQKITARLKQGVLLFTPGETAVGPGLVTLAPRIDLNARPVTLVVDQGTVAEDVEITPEMFDSWFKYVAPVLAGATTAEGRMSIRLSEARVPLAQPTASTVSGSIEVKRARVRPGPMARQLLGTVTELATLIQRTAPDLGFLAADSNWLELEPQTVDFQMQQGRVYHRNLVLKSGKITVRTRGWVGMDQSVGLLAEIPIQDEWVAKHRLLASMRGQSIQIPIQGSLSLPLVDERAIAQLSTQLIGNTAQKFLQDELQKGLQKLLGPK